MALSGCSKTHRIDPVDIDAVANDAQSDIDNYAAARAASDRRARRDLPTR